MAISPDILKDTVKEEADLFEKFIDDKITKKLCVITENNITVTLNKSLTATVVKELEIRYKMVGWSSFQYSSSYDQRDGYGSYQIKLTK